MTAVADNPPQGRYGRGHGTGRDRGLRLIALVCGGLTAVGVVVGGWLYLRGDSVNADVVSFTVVSDTQVRAQVQVYKDDDQTVRCTLRSMSVDQAEVGRKAVTVSARGRTVDTVVTIRTTRRATDAELVGCSPADAG